jgi:hypothetical protein
MTQIYRRVWLHDFGLAFGKSTRPLAWIDIARMLSALDATADGHQKSCLAKSSQVKSSRVKLSQRGVCLSHVHFSKGGRAVPIQIVHLSAFTPHGCRVCRVNVHTALPTVL